MRKGKNNRLLKGVLVCETIAIIALLAVLILWINRPADVAKDQPQYALAEGSAESQPNEVSAEGTFLHAAPGGGELSGRGDSRSEDGSGRSGGYYVSRVAADARISGRGFL